MTTVRLSRIATLVSVCLSIAAYALADRFGVLAAVAIPVAVAGWWVTELRRAKPVPKLAINLLVTASIVWSFYRVVADRGVEGLTVSVFCQFLVLVLLVKLWDRKETRDVAQVLTLSIFLTIGAILTANTLGMGILVIANVLVTVFAVMSFHIAAGIERSAFNDRTLGALGARAPEPESVAIRAILRSFAPLCGTAIVLGLAVSVVVWIVMPRGVGESEFVGLGQFGGRRTGFTERVDLRRSGLITESTRTVLDLRLENREGFSVGTEGRHVYLRGAVLDTYDGRAWTKSPTAGPIVDMKLQGGKPWQIGPTDAQGAVVQRIVMRDVGASGVPVLAALDPVSVELEADAQLALQTAGRTLTRDGRPGRFAYTVTSIPPKPDEERSQISRTRIVGFRSETIGVEARRVLAQAGVEPDPNLRPPAWDSDACRAIERHLRSNYTYTLDTPSLRAGKDPIEGFLFETKAGHCEYFAAAMAAMTRSVGIPARVVAGYVANEFSAETESYTVRENSAHAWVEAMIADGVWATFDPTPPDGLLRQIRPPARFLAGWQHWLDSMDDAWSTSVVTFDEQSRKKLLGVDVNPAAWVQEHVSGWVAEYRSSDEGSRGRILSRAVLSVGVFGVALWLVARASRALLSGDWTRARTPQATTIHTPELMRAARIYDRALAALRRAGMAKPVWKPPLDHAETLGPSVPAAGALRRVSGVYYALRFGGCVPTAEELEGSVRAVAEIRGRASGRQPVTGAGSE